MFRLIVWYCVTVLCGNTINALDWWEGGNFYQIYPRSFMDSNGDGIGDLNGITSKLEYLKELGITGTWLSPIFQSPMVDFGYDISDYTQVHNEYGTLADFDRLVAKCRELDIKLILDFVPNHSSDKHEWFQKSVLRDPEYDNFYIWHPGFIAANGTRLPPNNWISVFRGSAWEWNDVRKEYYLHQFVKEQPDLNYREPKLVKAMKDVLRLWLGRGVSGFRIDAVPYLYEIEADEEGNYPDEEVSGRCTDVQDECYLTHTYTQNRDETFDMAYQWRAVVDEFKAEFGGVSRILMTEAYTSLPNTIRFYTDGVRNGPQIPFNFELINNIRNESTAVNIAAAINSWMNLMPAGYQANWVMGNHDNKRLASRFGTTRADLLNILLQTLPGIAVTYNGEELALTDVHISYEDTVDPAACNTNSPLLYEEKSRDPVRTPFPWDDSPQAGFSTNASTWLPLALNYKTVNVKAQRLAPFSHLKIFKALTQIRKTKTFMEGDFKLATIGTNVLVYKRELAGNDTFVIVLNVSGTSQTINLMTTFPTLSSRLEVITSSLQSGYLAGDVISTTEVIAYAQVGTVFVAA